MKRWFPFVVFVLAGAVSLPAETVEQTYARGVRAYAGGNLDAARQLFEEVVAADPKNTSAITCLRTIAATRPAVDLRKQMEGIIVPKIDFHDTSLTTVLDYLPKLVAEQTKGAVALNIVRLFPSDVGAGKMVSLELSNVPMASVLDYVAQLTGMKLEYQQHAVVVGQADSPTAAPAQ